MHPKRIFFFLIGLICLGYLGNCPFPADAAADNLLLNGGFEVAQGSDTAWRTEFWRPGSLIGRTKKKVHSGNCAAILSTAVENDIRFIQTVKVMGNRMYRFSGWVATENIPQGKLGANLSVMNDMVHSEGITGNTAWRPLKLVFRTYPSQREVTVAVRLGFFGDPVTGTAYFDDLRLEPVNDANVTYYQLKDPANQKPVLFYHNTDNPADLTQLENRGIFLLILAFVILYILLFACLRIKPGHISQLNDANTLNQRDYNIIFTIFVLSAFLLRIPLFGGAPFPTDLGNFKAWALHITETGPGGFYAPGYFCDYPPASLYILWVVGWLVKAFHLAGNDLAFNFLVKLPSFLFDIGSAWLIFRLLRQKNSFLALALSSLYLILPAIAYNSAYWGQMDTYYVFLMLLTFTLLRERQPELGAVCVAVSFLAKAQTIAFMPLLIFYLVLNFPPRRWLSTLGSGLAMLVLVILPFNIGHSWNWIIDLYQRQAALYPYASVNAANFIALCSGNYQLDNTPFLLGLTYAQLGLGLFFACVLWSCYYYWRKRTVGSLAVAFAMVSFAFFMFCPRMHERYLFPVFAFLLLAIGFYKDKRLYFITLILSLTYLLNMHTVVLSFKNMLDGATANRAYYILALLHCGLLVSFWAIFQFRLIHRKSRWFAAGYTDKLRKALLTKTSLKPFSLERKDCWRVGIILLVYAGLLFFRLGSWSTPQTGMILDSPEKAQEVRFKVPVTIATVVWYDAGNSGELLVKGVENGSWKTLAVLDCNSYYVLKRAPVQIRGVERIRLVPNPAAGRVNQVAFIDPLGHLIPVQSVLSLEDNRVTPAAEHPLFDEQAGMLARPSYLNSTYFDEIYHGRTAYEFVTGSSVYETTHPPLGKDLLSLGILIFGMNPFGMRFMHAMAGLALMIALFFLGREVLGTRFGAYGTMLLGVLDFMPLVQSRYATIDTTSVLFIVIMFLFTFKYLRLQEQFQGRIGGWIWLALIMLGFGLAVSVKWTAPYGFLGVFGAILWVKIRQYLHYRQVRTEIDPRKTKALLALKKLAQEFWLHNILKTLGVAILCFIVIVPVVYYLSYIPFLHAEGITDIFGGSGLKAVLNNQLSMYDYHAHLVATHPFASSWWGWPLDFKPLWLYIGNYEAPGFISTIVTLGNPLIWYLGVAALLILGYQLLILRRFSWLYFVFVFFLCQYLPWILVSRITFIYHYYPVLPLVYLLVVFLLEPFWEMDRPGKGVIYGIYTAMALLLVLFYPALTGLAVPGGYLTFLHWFPRDWIFF